MTIKQFIEEAKKIGCPEAFISATAAGNAYMKTGLMEIIYRIWCSKCSKHTEDYPNPEEALNEFRKMHKLEYDTRERDIILTEEAHEN